MRGFTEAVPLSLSSMAHMAMPLEDGVLDGLKQVLQHTLLSCVNYARAIHAPHKWSFRDLTTTKYAWEAHEGEEPRDLPASLLKLGFKHQYHRTAFIYLKSSMKEEISQADELGYIKDWSKQKEILGRISLLYTTTALMTKEELNGTERDDDTPKCVLYKIIVEYRSLPATGKKAAVQAEELSMLSFGGSVDDDVKFGALASLYDPHAKYVLEIYSVRGKKYKFDLMDSTLSDGTVPRLVRNGAEEASEKDPFVKSLCVTVTDHNISSREAPNTDKDEKREAVTRIHMIMEGNLRTDLDSVPKPHYMAEQLQDAFLSLKHAPPDMATGFPSGHTLITDPEEAGKVYINGRFVTTWGEDPRIGTHFPALFGMDLHSIPYWHGRIFDFEMLKRAYATLIQEVLIDARMMSLNIGGRLLGRLISGEDPLKEEEDDEYDYDLDDDEESDGPQKKKRRIVTNVDCLESQVIESKIYDPVGISARALATRFKYEYGEDGFPCLAHEIEWVKDRLPGRVPVPVPQRVINVLRRGGFFDTKRTSDEVWFSESRPANKGTKEEELVNQTVELLKKAGCTDVTPNMVVFFSGKGIKDPIKKKGLVRFNRMLRQYHVNEYFMEMDLVELDGGSTSMDGSKSKSYPFALAYLLGLHIAQEHPDGAVLLRYLLKNR